LDGLITIAFLELLFAWIFARFYGYGKITVWMDDSRSKGSVLGVAEGINYYGIVVHTVMRSR